MSNWPKIPEAREDDLCCVCHKPIIGYKYVAVAKHEEAKNWEIVKVWYYHLLGCTVTIQ